MMRHYNIPVFIPHEGCPFDCAFCNQRKITGVTTSVSPKRAEETIRAHLSYLPQGERSVEVAFFGGSFTGLPLSLQEEFYQVAESFGSAIDGIRLSTRPDYINREVLTCAASHRVRMIELGAQSSCDAVLEKNHRGHTFRQTAEAVVAIRQSGIGVGLQMMTGMDGSDREKDWKTAVDLAGLAPDCVRIYPTLVLGETALEKRFRHGAYTPQSLEEAVEGAKEILLFFREKKIPVIRLGLHVGEDLREPGAVVAGPFHPAFGELVEGRIWRDRLERQWQEQDFAGKEFAVTVPRDQVSKAVGHGRSNVIYFEEKYGVTLRIREMTEGLE